MENILYLASCVKSQTIGTCLQEPVTHNKTKILILLLLVRYHDDQIHAHTSLTTIMRSFFESSNSDQPDPHVASVIYPTIITQKRLEKCSDQLEIMPNVAVRKSKIASSSRQINVKRTRVANKEILWSLSPESDA